MQLFGQRRVELFLTANRQGMIGSLGRISVSRSVNRRGIFWETDIPTENLVFRYVRMLTIEASYSHKGPGLKYRLPHSKGRRSIIGVERISLNSGPIQETKRVETLTSMHAG